MSLDAAYWKAQVPDGRLFADPQPSPDEASFQVDNSSEAYYNSVYFLRHKEDLQPVPAPKVVQPKIDLNDVLGADFLQPSVDAKRIVFHAVGDTGAAKVNAQQSAAQAIANEASVADAMAVDVTNGGANGPLFFLHLGDVALSLSLSLSLSLCESAACRRFLVQCIRWPPARPAAGVPSAREGRVSDPRVEGSRPRSAPSRRRRPTRWRRVTLRAARRRPQGRAPHRP